MASKAIQMNVKLKQLDKSPIEVISLNMLLSVEFLSCYAESF
ncbi:MAG: hypothetical protein OFPI_30490 [Osedax symbiont Rs2]|nr:MAG: hypothetical protein OFPI_30490 [Osedax symbiont Rs2]